MMTNCNHYVEDLAGDDGFGEPTGQCVRCGDKWFRHWNFALPTEEINDTLQKIRDFQKVVDYGCFQTKND